MLRISHDDLLYRLTNQKNPILNNPDVQLLGENKLQKPSIDVSDYELQKIMASLGNNDIDTSWGVEVLSLYPEHKNEILPIYYNLFPTMDKKGKQLLASLILNLEPEKKDKEDLLSLFTQELEDKIPDQQLLWVLAQPLARAVDKDFSIIEKLVRHKHASNYRIFFLERLPFTPQKDKATKLALDMLNAEDFETIAGALKALKRLNVKINSKTLLNLSKHPAPYIRKQVKSLLDL